ncbi:MAG: hypothetical protein H0U44_07910 [Flavisolibacter sp.]|jgi:hypothetical protein|nr:hypothetical protein [Flavisolibacter sp.]
MKFTLSLTLGKEAQSKAATINNFFRDIDAFIQRKNYGNGILEYFIICQIINPPNGYEHLFKDIKPKFIEFKSLINKHTGEPLVIEKQFSYSIKIKREKFIEFINASDKESIKMIVSEILNSLSNLDALPKKVKDFDKDSFKEDMKRFFDEQNLI